MKHLLLVRVLVISKAMFYAATITELLLLTTTGAAQNVRMIYASLVVGTSVLALCMQVIWEALTNIKTSGWAIYMVKHVNLVAIELWAHLLKHPLKARPEWRPNKDGSISCPPKSIGGCGGKGILKLNQVLPDGWLSNKISKAEDLYELYNLDGMSEDPIHWCSCYNLARDNTATKKIRKATSRENSDDNTSTLQVL